MRIYRIGFLGERTGPGRIGSQFSSTGRRYSESPREFGGKVKISAVTGKVRRESGIIRGL